MLDAALLHAIAESFFLFVFMFIVSLAVVIIIHELGHYIAARLCGVDIEQFSFGFGKEIFGFGGQDRQSTRWSVCLFPIGGYVKLFGDVDKDNPIIWDKENNCEHRLTEAELEKAFATKSVWQRIFIVAAGPFINILLTVLIFTGVFTTIGQRSKPVYINAINVGSAADIAGIQIGDKVVKMDGRPLRRLRDIYEITWNEKPPKVHTYTIERDGQALEIPFAAKYVEYTNRKEIEKQHGQTGMVQMPKVRFENILNIDGVDTTDNQDFAREEVIKNFDKEITFRLKMNNTGEKRIGDAFRIIFPKEHNSHLNDPDHEEYDSVNIVDIHKRYFVRLSVLESLKQSYSFMRDTLIGTYKLVQVIHKGKTDEPVIGGIGKISQRNADAFQAGPYSYLMFLAALSFMIAFVNLLPIPVLDGGYLLFLFYELLSGKPVSPRIQYVSIIIGLVFLIGIMIFANIMDVLSFINPE